MEQLIVVVLIVVFTVGDLFLRWAKKQRGGGQAPSPPQEERGFDVEVEELELPDWFERLQRQQEAQRREEDLERQRRQQAPVPRPVAAERSPAVPLMPKPSEAEAALAARMERSAIGRPPRVGTHGVFRVRQWMQDPQDVRKGIILMNVLGTPKGLE
jgi:hypothetical protein